LISPGFLTEIRYVRAKGLAPMRHYASVKAICGLALLLVPYALADESADRLAIDHTIAGLNELPQRMELFAAGAEISNLEGLRKLTPGPTFRTLRQSSDPGTIRIDQPTITISHEPWGEAMINFPEMTAFPVEILNPRIVRRTIRFITPDVALAEGTWTYEGSGSTLRKPLLFVMKKEGATWRIASLHLLAGPY
jgi:hypothetical protein